MTSPHHARSVSAGRPSSSLGSSTSSIPGMLIWGTLLRLGLNRLRRARTPAPREPVERFSVGKVCDPVSSITAILETSCGRLVGHAS